MEDKKGSMTGCENQIDDQRMISQFLPCENSIMYENCDHESIGELALGQPGNFNSTKIYHSLTSREWNTIGYFDPEIVDSSSLTEIMIDHIVSILFHHVTKLPAYESNAEPSTSSVVKFQLRNLVVAIEDSYEQNHFHSFNHAYQVVVSMNKLIDEITRDPPSKIKTNLFFQDPLFAFSLVFGALIHDVGHTGMSNQILKEQHHSLCDIYNHHDESIAERYSLDLAIKIFNLNEFNDLRNIILPDEIHRVKFGKALFHSILITDITSKERNKMSLKRFELTAVPPYSELTCQCECCTDSTSTLSEQKCLEKNSILYDSEIDPMTEYLDDVLEGVNVPKSFARTTYRMEFEITHCKLQTISMIEHFMLLSDVGHLMQGWNNFVKWNFRLYKEIIACYKKGLCGDPSSGWYKGQIGFFDFYIIPLAKRGSAFFTSKDFGIKLVEQAEINKNQWIEHGEKATDLMINAALNDEEETTVLRNLYLLVT